MKVDTHFCLEEDEKHPEESSFSTTSLKYCFSQTASVSGSRNVKENKASYCLTWLCNFQQFCSLRHTPLGITWGRVFWESYYYRKFLLLSRVQENSWFGCRMENQPPAHRGKRMSVRNKEPVCWRVIEKQTRIKAQASTWPVPELDGIKVQRWAHCHKDTCDQVYRNWNMKLGFFLQKISSSCLDSEDCLTVFHGRHGPSLTVWISATNLDQKEKKNQKQMKKILYV